MASPLSSSDGCCCCCQLANTVAALAHLPSLADNSSGLISASICSLARSLAFSDALIQAKLGPRAKVLRKWLPLREICRWQSEGADREMIERLAGRERECLCAHC